MKKFTLVLLAISVSVPAVAQLRPPQREAVRILNPDMVIENRGAKIEIYPERRVALSSNSQGVTTMRERAAAASATAAPLSSSPALVFNHAYRQYGYATGEITFKFKRDVARPSLSEVSPGARKIGNLDMFVVTAKSPSDLVALVERLRARSDLEWVEPTINYIPLAADARK
jgi:hypothetical protein